MSSRKELFLIVSTFLVVAVVAQGLGEKPNNCITVNGDNDKIVCVCNARTCDWLRYEFPTTPGTGNLISTTKQGERFTITSLETTNTNQTRPRRRHSVRIDLGRKYQSILGWGGAFTDAAGININSLQSETRSQLLSAYFDRDGLQYNMGRVPIGGADFSSRNYSYDDLGPNAGDTRDYELTHWSLAEEDLKYKIPLIKDVFYKRQSYSMKDELKLFGSPWSPPAWMKDNHNLTRGHLIDDEKIYESYANYLVKFYQSYEKELSDQGIKFWGGTVQNEPMTAMDPSYFFNSLELGADQATKFIGKYLGPALVKNGFTKDRFKLMVSDDNLGKINQQVPVILRNPEAQKYISGLAFHWYESGWHQPYDRLSDCMRRIRGKVEFALMTEACNGWRKGKEPAVDLGSWTRGEAYAVDIIQDLLRGSGGWIDWNLALDMDGGPNWVNNTVDSPIIVNAEKDEFYKQPMYYVLGHFSRFFKPGSTRVRTSPFTRSHRDRLMTVAVYNEEQNSVVVNVLNRFKEQVSLQISIRGQPNNRPDNRVQVTLEPESMGTVVYRLQ